MLLAASANASDSGAVDFIGTVAGAIDGPPERVQAPTTVVVDPILNPSSVPVAKQPYNPTPVVGGTMNNPTYNGQPVAGVSGWSPAGYTGGPSIGYGYVPPVAVKQFQAPTTALDSGPTQLPTVTTIASNISTHWKLVAVVGLAVVLLVALFRFRR